MSARELIKQYFTAVNTHDWDLLAEVLHPEVDVRHGTSIHAQGRERSVKLLKAVTAQFAEHEDRPTRWIGEGPMVAVEIDFEGRLPDGRKVAFDAADVFDVDGQHIRSVSSWYDTAEVTRLIRGEPTA